jgi:hypothetical protein
VTPIPALEPRRGAGHQFVFYGDCCSGVPGAPAEGRFAAVNAVVARLAPRPEFICFLGDHIAGDAGDAAGLHRQWRHWLDREMAWLDPATPVYHLTSNHNTESAEAERVWRAVFPGLPRNGPPGQEGLSYHVRRGDLLLVCTNSAFSGLGGYGHVECDWLDRVLSDHADAAHKLVAGHYPVFPVNGYDQHPAWRIVPDQGRAFWDVLTRHGVTAYLCSHIIAFDVQARGGVLQICSGGAGTHYGPRDFMPGPVEFLHAVQAVVDGAGLRYQVLDVEGQPREWLQWPFQPPPEAAWHPMSSGGDWQSWRALWPAQPMEHRILLARFSGVCAEAPVDEEQTLLCAWSWADGPAPVWIGLQPATGELAVQLVPESGAGAQSWRGPRVATGRPFDFQLAIHSGMGPGGVLWRAGEGAAWSSLSSSSARGAETLAVPDGLTVRHGPSGPGDRPFRGRDLRVQLAAARAAFHEAGA